MLWWLIPLIIIALSVVTIIAVLFRKIPQLRIINVDEIPEEKVKKVKERIIMEKIQRASFKKVDKVAKFGSGAVSTASKAGRRLVQKVYALEQHYRKMQKGTGDVSHATSPEAIKRLLDEASDFIRKEEYFEAEKRYIEIISHNPKHVETYEELGNLYMLEKKFKQAHETLEFAVKLDPEDASVHVSLGELAMKENDFDEALKQMKKAVELRGHNPKYLDLYIEAAICAKSVIDGKKGLRMLREVNPENKKLDEFEKRIDEVIEQKYKEAEQKNKKS